MGWACRLLAVHLDSCHASCPLGHASCLPLACLLPPLPCLLSPLYCHHITTARPGSCISQRMKTLSVGCRPAATAPPGSMLHVRHAANVGDMQHARYSDAVVQHVVVGIAGPAVMALIPGGGGPGSQGGAEAAGILVRARSGRCSCRW